MKKLLFLLLLIPALSFGQKVLTYGGKVLTDGTNVLTFTEAAYCDEYQAVYDAFTTKPSDAVASNQDILVSTLVASGVWAKLDVFYNYAQTTNGDALINWTNPGTFDATAYSAPTFTALEGFTGDGSADYIDCNWNPSSDGVNYVQNSASIGVYVRTDAVGIMSDIGSHDTGSGFQVRIYPRLVSGDNCSNRINDGATLTYVNADSRGMYVLIRIASNIRATYKNKVSKANDTEVSTGVVNLNLYTLAKNLDGAASDFSTRQISMAFAGSGLSTDDITSITDAFEVYMDSNGKGVIP